MLPGSYFHPGPGQDYHRVLLARQFNLSVDSGVVAAPAPATSTPGASDVKEKTPALADRGLKEQNNPNG